MILIGYDKRQIDRLVKSLGTAEKKLPRELRTAINATARKTKTAINKEIRTELPAPAKEVGKAITVKSLATPTTLSATVTVRETYRLSLKYLQARQTRAGVSYKASKSRGRQVAAGAFMGPRVGAVATKLRGHAFKRVGKSRLPIYKLFGASPWGVFQKQKMLPVSTRKARKELRKQIERRIRFNVLKQTGLI